LFKLAGRDRASLEIHLEAVIERDWRCTWRRRSSELRRCTSRPGLSELGHALGGRDRVNSEDLLGGNDRLSLEMHLQAMIERD